MKMIPMSIAAVLMLSLAFEKFLIGRDGEVLDRFRSAVEPESREMVRAIEAALAAK